MILLKPAFFQTFSATDATSPFNAGPPRPALIRSTLTPALVVNDLIRPATVDPAFVWERTNFLTASDLPVGSRPAKPVARYLSDDLTVVASSVLWQLHLFFHNLFGTGISV